MKCSPLCTRVKVGKVVVFDHAVTPPKYIEKHYCGKPVAVKDGTLILRPLRQATPTPPGTAPASKERG